MKKIIVYGSGCQKCTATVIKFEKISQELGLKVEIIKEMSLEKMMAAGVMSTPAVAIDGQLVHTGSEPSSDQVKAMLLK